MAIKKIINYLKQCHQLCTKVAHLTGNNIIYVLYDYFIAFIKHGCLIKQYYYGKFYSLPRYMRKKAFTQRRLHKVIEKYNSNDYIHLLENKNEFNQYFKAYVNRKWVFSPQMTWKDFNKLFNEVSEIIIKPFDSQEGDGIEIIDTNRTGLKEIFDKVKNNKSIIEEVVNNCNELDFENKSLNTLRIITFLDSHNVPHILRSSLRAGVGKSVVDNFTQGGILYNIDKATGIINGLGIDHKECLHVFHPGTSIIMLGKRIPFWEEVIDVVTNAAKLIPQIRFIGWDVAITPNGVELIEGNHNPGLFTMESLGSPGAYGDMLNIEKN